MIAVLFGTRPEAIKLGPVVAELRARSAPLQIVCTGQHTDLLRGTPAETDLKDSVSLNVQSQGEHPQRYAERLAIHVQRHLEKSRPSVVVVQGDTSSALAGAEAASRLGIPVHHVEAGLRSFDCENPWPEEGFRRRITQLAAVHYAPTETNRANLLTEGVPDTRIHVTGNPVVSAIERYAPGTPPDQPDPVILITMHRREWLNRGRGHVQETFRAANRFAAANPGLRVVWPMHPATANLLWGHPVHTATMDIALQITAPTDYRRTIELLRSCLGVATDSGGLQEEAATLGTPCAVLRTATDRPESIQTGQARLYDPTPQGLTIALEALLAGQIPRIRTEPFGKPDAATKIATLIARYTA